MATVFILHIPPNCNFKKGSYFLTIVYIENVIWPHEAKTYVNSILMGTDGYCNIVGVLRIHQCYLGKTHSTVIAVNVSKIKNTILRK